MKKLFMIFAVAGFLFAGCSQSEVEEYNSKTPDAIKFTTTTSRAAINTLTDLQGNATGFKVAAKDNATSAWYVDAAGTKVDGTNNYKYSSGAWGWAGTAAKWPTATSFSLDFYAMYPDNTDATVPTGLYTSVLTTGTSFSATVKIPADAANQRDLLAAKSIGVTNAPFDGTLPLTFNHILAKVDYGIIAGYGVSTYVQSVNTIQTNSVGTYNYVTSTWSGIANPADYPYLKAADAASPVTVTGTDATEKTAQPLYGLSHDKHLMLVPHTTPTTAWVPVSGATAGTGVSYIEVVYRLERGADHIGWSDATDYLAKYTSHVDTGWGSTYTGISTGANPYNDRALFVKVGFPASFNWVAGKGYVYNICLGIAGGSGGHYITETYYDEDGVDTGIPIIGTDGETVEPGDPVYDGIIHFAVAVGDFDDQTPTVVGQ